VLDEETLETAVEYAFRRRLVGDRFLCQRLDELGGSGRPGSGILRGILDRRREDPALESRLEASRGWRIVPVTWDDATERSNQWLAELGRTLALAA
jgi:hypothetical protein